MDSWAIDLGTTNTGVAIWDQESGQAQLVELPRICRQQQNEDPLEAPRMVPSSVHLLPKRGVLDRIGAWPPVAKRIFLGTRALIGQPALAENQGVSHPAFAPTFKAALMNESSRPLARLGSDGWSARQVAKVFLRELLVEIKRERGRRVRKAVITVPVSAFETYRAELLRIGKGLGIQELRFLDEPVAAALGYGLSLAHERTILVVDIGGGTMHLALVRLSPSGAAGGSAHVLGKQVRPFGGNAVDGWVLADVCEKAGWSLNHAEDEQTRFWRRLMLDEARRVKEATFFDETAAFHVLPPGAIELASTRRPGSQLVTLERERLQEILANNGFFTLLEQCLEGVLGLEASQPVPMDEVDEVLMVGGSTLLPGVYPFFEQRFGRRRIRAWHPFEAVALGAATFSAERFSQADFVAHDYAFLTHDPATSEPRYTVIIPRGTRYPTARDLWKRQVVPTCSLGEPESLFKLVICELSRSDGDRRRFVWDAGGDLHKIGGDDPTDSLVVVPLNEDSPTLGYLDPPHAPGDRRPRLEIAFGINDDRWLIATVTDLFNRKLLLDSEPVLRLL